MLWTFEEYAKHFPASLAHCPVVVPAKTYKGRYIPPSYYLRTRVGADEFCEGERPVVMLGSILARYERIGVRGRYATTVAERWMRMKKITATDDDSFRAVIDAFQKLNVPRSYNINKNKGPRKERPAGELAPEWLYVFSRGSVWLNGKRHYVDDAKKEAIKALGKIADKIDSALAKAAKHQHTEAA